MPSTAPHGPADLPLGTVRIAAGPWNSRFMARRLRGGCGALPIEIELSNEMAFAARREMISRSATGGRTKGRVAVRRCRTRSTRCSVRALMSMPIPQP